MKGKYLESDFNANDRYELSNIGKFVVNAIEIYEKKSKIEGFIHLHGAIEAQLLALWTSFLMLSLKEKFKPIQKFWDFKDSIELLKQVGILNDDLKSKLCAFKTGRDNVAHLITNKFRKVPITDKALDDQFKKGIESYKDLIKIRQNLVKQIDSAKQYDEGVYIEIDPTPKGSVIITAMKDGKRLHTITYSVKVTMRATGLAVEKEKGNYVNMFSDADLADFEKKEPKET